MGDVVDYAETCDVATIKAIVENLPDDGSLLNLALTQAIAGKLPNDGSLLDLSYIRQDAGIQSLGRAVTAVLRVWPNGDDSDGSSFSKAYTTIPRALDATSVNDYDCTLIWVSPHGAGYYDMDMTGDPEWDSNVIIKGTHRNWAKVKNDHISATSILKLTGRSSVIDLNFNLGIGNNGLIQTRGGARTRHCQFVGEDLTSPAIALWYDTNSAKHYKADDLDFLGKDATLMTAFKVDELCCSEFTRLRMHKCLVGIHIVGDNAHENLFNAVDIGECAKAIKIDAGDEQHFIVVTLHHNTLNVEDVPRNHIWGNIYGAFPVTIEPVAGANYAGVTVNAGDDTWGADTELRAALTSTKPFRIVGYRFEPSEEKKFMIRFSADSGGTFFDMALIEVKKNKAQGAAEGTEFIFNAGTRISASAGCEEAGKNIKIWLEIQEI